MIKKIISSYRYIIPLFVGILIFVIPAPEGLSREAWQLFAIFVMTILGFIFKPFPMGATAIIGMCLCTVTGTLTIQETLTGFTNLVVWLIVLAFFISRGFLKTGLGVRIAYNLIKKLGKTSLGIAYGLIAADLILAPSLPSNTARGGGIMSPIVVSVAKAFQSDPYDKSSSKKIGAFLILCSFQGVVITSGMFLTSMGANPLVASLAGDQGVLITWNSWALGAIVPGILSLLLVPLVIYKLFPPTIKRTPNAINLANEKLKELGKIKKDEWLMLFVFFALLFLWIVGTKIQLNNTTTAFIGLSFLIITGVLTWEDVLNESNAWNVLIWLSTLVMMAGALNQLGMFDWFSAKIQALVGGGSWQVSFLVLILAYFYSHYFFASNTAHITAMYAPFLITAIALGTPPILAALVLAYFSNLYSSMTHYGTGPTPVYFGYGYVELGTWWRLGFIISIVNIVIWLGIGSVWWKILGFW